MVSLNEKRSKIRYIVQNKTEWVDGKSDTFINHQRSQFLYFENGKLQFRVKYFHKISIE
jgi:hypothetical protein